MHSPQREITRLKKSRAKVGRWVFAAVKTVAWELTYFDQEVSDAIIYSYNPALFAGGYIQVPGTSQFSGVEATASWAVGEGVTLEGFVSDLSAEDASGNDLPYRPETTAQVSARFGGERLTGYCSHATQATVAMALAQRLVSTLSWTVLHLCVTET